MAKGQARNRQQDKIVKRYYEHRETIMTNRLSEIVSDLWLAEDKKQADKLWKRADQALSNTDVEDARVRQVVDERDLEGLVRLTNDLAVGEAGSQGAEQSTGGHGGATRTTGSKPAAPASSSAGASEKKAMAEKSTGGDAPAAPTPDQLKQAYHAFKKRLKAKRLDTSAVGRSPLSGGKSQVLAIQPPREFPQSVWEELVRQGRLKRHSRGLYSLP